MAESFVFIGNAAGCIPLASRLMQAGMRNADNLEDADAIFVYCVGQSIHEDLFFEENGLLAEVQAGKLIVDLSPATPNLSKEIFTLCSLSGIDYVEAPIALADIAAEEGYLDPANVIIRVSGENRACEAAMPALNVLSEIVVRCGETSKAQLAKCVDTIQVCAQVASAIEAQALVTSMAQQEGVAVESLMGVGFLQGMEQADAFTAAVYSGGYRSQNGYTLETFLAEVTAVQLAAEDLSLALPHSQSVQYVAELLAAAGGAELSPAALALAFGDFEAGKEFGVDWSRLEGAQHEHGEDCDCGHDHDGECECGHGEDSDHECTCGKDGHDADGSQGEGKIFDDDDWLELDDDDPFRLDFNGVDAFDADSYGENPYPDFLEEKNLGLDDDWASN